MFIISSIIYNIEFALQGVLPSYFIYSGLKISLGIVVYGNWTMKTTSYKLKTSYNLPSTSSTFSRYFMS